MPLALLGLLEAKQTLKAIVAFFLESKNPPQIYFN